ncbi:hypothetical protein DY000_02033800 [Brassica cretica]|uniref:CCHC-type domain-containing protein n=1 Tax=Brassica cretica TaxID=69181 RepID=A0ABQ7DQI3_BRACR|nr:hypothetical protein DY000_02033800 [Brassica cretica]
MERAKLPFKKCFSWNGQNKSFMGFMVDDNMKEKERRGGFCDSPKVLQCHECKCFGHVADECANLQKRKKKTVTKSDSKSESDYGEELKSIVAFTTFMSGSKTKSAVGSASASVSGSSCGGDDDAGSDDEGGTFDLAGNYEKLYEHWLKLKEEEARQAGAQLAETQKNLRMLNNGTNQLDYLLRCSYVYTNPEVKRFAGNATNGKIAVKPATGVKNVTATRTATSTATATDTATAPERVSGLKSGSQQKFRHVCHHCGVVGHIRPMCFKLLREKNLMKQAYGMRYHGPVCYSRGVQGHIRRDCFRSVQGANHGGFGLRNTWSRRFDHYGDGGMGFPPHFGGYGSSY